MSTTAGPLHADLLDHQSFVLSIARSLVRDEHAAQDLAQDTWLTALRNPPRERGAVRGWLAKVVRNRAANTSRSQGRRADRERLVARDEVQDSTDALHERLALQHDVVSAVLALDQTYRDVVLLHYYEGLTAAEIAKRRNVPAGTVRSQLSRAHDRLRERLDTAHGGERKAWSAGLVAMIERSAPTASLWTGALPWIAAAGLLAGAVLTWNAIVDRALGDVNEPRGPHPALVALVEELEGEPDLEPAEDASPVRREVLAATGPASTDSAGGPDFSKASLDELELWMRQAQALMRRQILVPDERVAAEYADRLRQAGWGLTRITDRKVSGPEQDAVGIRGGGAYFSFTTLSHSYDQRPQIELSAGRYSSGFYGGSGGWVLEIGDLPLAELPDTPEVVPAGLLEAHARAWGLLASRTDEDPGARVRAIDEGLRQLGFRGSATGRAERTYLVRSISAGEADLLVALHVVAADEYGQTFLWRILREFPMEEERPVREVQIYEPLEREIPRWLATQDAEELFDTQDAIRQAGEARLLAIPEELTRRWSGSSERPGWGLARLLERTLQSSFAKDGCYYSFATRRNDYQAQPDLELQLGRFSSGFAGGDFGVVLDLGRVELDGLSSSAEEPPGSLDETQRGIWALAFTQGLSRGSPEYERVRELDGRVEAKLGHAYLLRAVLPGEHDHAVAFQVVEQDDYGVFLLFRVLKTWPTPPR